MVHLRLYLSARLWASFSEACQCGRSFATIGIYPKFPRAGITYKKREKKPAPPASSGHIQPCVAGIKSLAENAHPLNLGRVVAQSRKSIKLSG